VSLAALAPYAFGGSGGDGSVSLNSATISGRKRYDATSFIINGGQTVTYDSGPVNINSTGTVSIAGTMTLASSAGNNGGIGGGLSSNSQFGGSGGGVGGADCCQGYGLAGGNGGCSYLWAGGAGGQGDGTAGHAINANRPGGGGMLARSGGGAGGSATLAGTLTGGNGGSGGQPVLIEALGAVTIGGTINLYMGSVQDGVAGAGLTGSGGAAGGGAGAGSNCLIASQTSVTVTGTINGGGGTGGNGFESSGDAGGGGGGAPSTLLIWSPSISTGGGTITLSHGVGGNHANLIGGMGANGANSDTGSLLTLTGTPNNPLLVYLDQGEPDTRTFMLSLVQIARTRGEAKIVEIPHKAMCQLAAKGNIQKYFALQTERGLHPQSAQTCLGIGDNSASETMGGST